MQTWTIPKFRVEPPKYAEKSHKYRSSMGNIRKFYYNLSLYC